MFQQLYEVEERMAYRSLRTSAQEGEWLAFRTCTKPAPEVSAQAQALHSRSLVHFPSPPTTLTDTTSQKKDLVAKCEIAQA